MKPLINSKDYEDGPPNAQASQTSSLEEMTSWSRQLKKRLDIAVVIQFIYRCVKTCYPLICILLFACSSAFGQIKNGHEKNIELTKVLKTSNEEPQNRSALLTRKNKSLGNKSYSLTRASRPIVN